MLGEINKDLEPLKSRIFLCKPNRDTIAELPEAYKRNILYSPNGIHELTFQLPYVIEKDHKMIRNAHVDILRGHFLIRYEKGNEILWFVINKPKNVSDDEGKESKLVTCYLLPYQMNKKIIRGYSATKKLYDTIGSDGILNETLLMKTDWSVGYIDADIALKYRTFDISEKSLLEFMTTDIPEAFDCVILWDTVNKQVNIYKEDDIGTDKGATIEQGKYLKSIEQDPDFDNVVTRLYVYGKDGLTIQKNNASGSPYIEDFSYYLYPFERDANRNVLKHSAYMDDSLCHAILDYNSLLESKQGEFETYLTNKESKQVTLTTKENELDTLQNELDIIQDRIDIANGSNNQYSSTMTYSVDHLVLYNNTPYRCIQNTTVGILPTNSAYWENLITAKSNKETEITNKKSEINTVKTEINSIDTQINTLRNEIARENNFTPDQLMEIESTYVHEQVYRNQYIDNVEDLLEQGIKELNKVKQPIIHYSIGSVDFFKVVVCQRDWNKFKQFDYVTIRYPDFGINIKAKIISINHSEDDNSITFEIANAKDIKNGMITLKDLMQKTVSSSTTLDMSKFKWDKSESNANEINQILNNVWDASKREIVGGVNETVTFNERGLTITDSSDPLKFIRLTNSVLGMTGDGGNTFKLAIDSSGVYAQNLIGQIIAGQNLTIVNESGKYSMDANGFTIQGGSLTITDGLPESQINSVTANKINNSIQKSSLYNGVKIDTTDGLTATRSDSKVRSVFNATDGIKIEYNTGTTTTPNWVKKFYVDTNGVLNAEELITKKIKINDGSGNTLIDASTKTIDFTKFNTKIGKLSADNIDVTTFTAKSIKADQIELKGTNILDSLGDQTLNIDSNGNVTIKGNLNMTGGSINWGAITKPTYNASEVGAKDSDWLPQYNEVQGSKPPSNADVTLDVLKLTKADGTNKGIKYNATTDEFELNLDKVTAGKITAEQISGGTYTVKTGAVIAPSSSGIAGIKISATDTYITDGNVSIGDMSGSGSYDTRFYGTVDFTNASVVGVVAKWG